MKTSNLKIITAGDMSQATVASSPVDLEQIYGFSIQAVMTGAPMGMLQVQGSNDLPSPVTWSDIDTQTANVTAPGSVMFEMATSFYRWGRLLYTKTSGTGTIDARFNAKGV